MSISRWYNRLNYIIGKINEVLPTHRLSLLPMIHWDFFQTQAAKYESQWMTGYLALGVTFALLSMLLFSPVWALVIVPVWYLGIWIRYVQAHWETIGKERNPHLPEATWLFLRNVSHLGGLYVLAIYFMNPVSVLAIVGTVLSFSTVASVYAYLSHLGMNERLNAKTNSGVLLSTETVVSEEMPMNTSLMFSLNKWLRVFPILQQSEMLIQALRVRMYTQNWTVVPVEAQRVQTHIRLQVMAAEAYAERPEEFLQFMKHLEQPQKYPRLLQLGVLSIRQHGLLTWLKGQVLGHSQVDDNGRVDIYLPSLVYRVLMDRQAALGADGQINQTLAKNWLQHMVKYQRLTAPSFVQDWGRGAAVMVQILARLFSGRLVVIQTTLNTLAMLLAPVSTWRAAAASLPENLRLTPLAVHLRDLDLNSQDPLAIAYRRLIKHRTRQNRHELVKRLFHLSGAEWATRTMNTQESIIVMNFLKGLGIPFVRRRRSIAFGSDV